MPPQHVHGRVTEADRTLRAVSPTRVVGHARRFPYGRNLHARVQDPDSDTGPSVAWPTGRPWKQPTVRASSPLVSSSEQSPSTSPPVSSVGAPSPWTALSTPSDWDTPPPCATEDTVADRSPVAQDHSQVVPPTGSRKNDVQPPVPPERLSQSGTAHPTQPMADTPYESPVPLDAMDRDHSYVNSADVATGVATGERMSRKERHNSIVWNSLASNHQPLRGAFFPDKGVMPTANALLADGEGLSTEDEETYDNPPKPQRHGFTVGKREHQLAQVQHRRASRTNAGQSAQQRTQGIGGGFDRRESTPGGAATDAGWEQRRGATVHHVGTSHQFRRSATYEENFPPNYQRRLSLDGLMLASEHGATPSPHNDYEYDDSATVQTSPIICTTFASPDVFGTTVFSQGHGGTVGKSPNHTAQRSTPEETIPNMGLSVAGGTPFSTAEESAQVLARAPTVPYRTHIYENFKDTEKIAVREESTQGMHIGDSGQFQDRRTTKFEAIEDMC